MLSPLYSFFSLLPRPPLSSLFPSTTLFRSPWSTPFWTRRRCSATPNSMTARSSLSRMTILCGVLKVGAVHDRKSTRLNSSHLGISYAVFCLKKKNKLEQNHLNSRKNKYHTH